MRSLRNRDNGFFSRIFENSALLTVDYDSRFAHEKVNFPLDTQITSGYALIRLRIAMIGISRIRRLNIKLFSQTLYGICNSPQRNIAFQIWGRLAAAMD